MAELEQLAGQDAGAGPEVDDAERPRAEHPAQRLDRIAGTDPVVKAGGRAERKALCVPIHEANVPGVGTRPMSR